MAKEFKSPRVITWNVAGAKYLEKKKYPREDYKAKVNAGLLKLVQGHSPDIIVLQEIVQTKTALDKHNQDIIEAPEGYHYTPSIAIDTENQSHPTKWSKYFEKGGWAKGDYLAQGCGILWRSDLSHGPLWSFDSEDIKASDKLEKEVVRLETGLFTGTRDTEPRIAVISRFIFKQGVKEFDLLIINLHLTTLKGEREGSSQIDYQASNVRISQLNTVLFGVVSRYNEWVNDHKKQHSTEAEIKSRPPAVWLLAGDLNCMPKSVELEHVNSLNFMNLNPDEAFTKGSGVPLKEATITLDYILAGPVYHALDPSLMKRSSEDDSKHIDKIKVSDHYPVCADIPITNT